MTHNQAVKVARGRLSNDFPRATFCIIRLTEDVYSHIVLPSHLVTEIKLKGGVDVRTTEL